ncbi:streptamidine family RiPP [Actinosynnema sp. CS-041913]
MDQIFVNVEDERLLPHNSATHSNALVENPFDGGDDE